MEVTGSGMRLSGELKEPEGFHTQVSRMVISLVRCCRWRMLLIWREMIEKADDDKSESADMLMEILVVSSFSASNKTFTRKMS